MIEYREWHSRDKSTWANGDWNSEPDKIQWQDEATGMPCLIVRNGSGALCGYVGVSKSHPAYGHDYGNYQSDNPIDQQILAIDVHGGLTFASAGREATKDDFELMQGQVEYHRKEALRYPTGDSARWLDNWQESFNDFEKWKDLFNSRSICHVPPGEDAVWWFGFDCAHHMDHTPEPKYNFSSPKAGYRNMAYVKAECASLAQQLGKIK